MGEGKIRDPFMRKTSMITEFIIDTLECAIAWDKIETRVGRNEESLQGQATRCHESFVPLLSSQERTFYFIFIGRFNAIDEYIDYQASVIESISSQRRRTKPSPWNRKDARAMV